MQQGAVAARRVQVQGRRRQATHGASAATRCRRRDTVSAARPSANAWGASTATRSPTSSRPQARGRRGAVRRQVARHTAVRTAGIDRRAARTSATTSGCNRAGFGAHGGRQRADQRRGHVPAGVRDARTRPAVSTIPSSTGTSRCRSTSTMRWDTRSTTTCSTRVPPERRWATATGNLDLRCRTTAGR